MVQDFTAALMRMAQEVAKDPKLHTKEWAQELGTQEWLRRGKILHQLEKDKKAIRDVLQKRNAELSDANIQVAHLSRGYEKLPEYDQALKLSQKWSQHRAHAEGDIRDSQRIVRDMQISNPKYARQFEKSVAPIGMWAAFVTGLFGFNAYAEKIQKFQSIEKEAFAKKEGFNLKVAETENLMSAIAKNWQDTHKEQLTSARANADEMAQKVAATRMQLDTYERQANVEQAQARAHFKKVFEGKLSPATQKEFSKHLEYVHSHKVAPNNPTAYTDNLSDTLFMQNTLWLLASDYETSYSTISHTASDLSTSSHTDFSSSMISDYGMGSTSSSHTSSGYESHSSSYTDTSSSHSSWSPSPSSCGSSCGGGGGD